MSENTSIAQRLRENADLDAMEHCNPVVIALEREAAAVIDALNAQVHLLMEELDQHKTSRQRAERDLTYYATAARVISLHLADFMPKPSGSEDPLPIDEAIAEAARRAGAEIKRLQEEIETIRAQNAHAEDSPCEFCVHADKAINEAPCIDCEPIGFASWSQYKPTFEGAPAWGDLLHYLSRQGQHDLGRIVREGMMLIAKLQANESGK